MKKTNKRMLIMLALLVVAALLMFASCGNNDVPNGSEQGATNNGGDTSSVPNNNGNVDNSGNNGDNSGGNGNGSENGGSTGNTDNSGSTGGNTENSGSTNDSSTSSTTKPGDEDKPQTKAEYTILILDKNTGKPIPNVSVFIQDEAEFGTGVSSWGKTSENGSLVLKAEPSRAKYVYVENFPKGYVHQDFYELGTTGVEIRVGTEIIENSKNDFNGITLEIGDVMYDFELTAYVYNKDTGAIETKTVSLSDLFANGKKAVMLNFWYTTCTYCIEEFPYIQAAYEKYGDSIEIIGLNAYAADTDRDIREFMENFAKVGYYTDEGCALTFPMIQDTKGLQDAFGFTVNPCSVIIDRYGVISMVQRGGVLGERYFTNAFEHYVKADYEQGLYYSIYDLSPLAKPDIEMSPESEIKDAVVNGDINITFRPETEGEDAEYAWPFIVYEKDGRTCIASTNVDLDNSYCILYVDVELKAGQAVMFDYYASTQRLYDVLYVLVDGKDIYTISGRPMEDDDGNLLQEPWQACCPWVANEDGVYEIAFCYIKDESDMEGDDRVYLDNFRIVDAKDLDIETYIPRYAATDKYDDIFFGSYADIVYNEKDGYYHVGTVDGPLLLASLLGSNTQLSLLFPEEERFTVTTVLVDNGEFIYNGVNVYSSFIMYCNYASNSKLYGYCPVTPELKNYLDEFAKQHAFMYDENTWLQLCSYYEAYGTASQLEDPIKGLATFSAYEAIETMPGEAGFKNTVTYTQIVMPRGFLYKFVPTKSGVYRITSNSSQEVNGWVFVGNFEQWVKENGGDRVLYIDSSTGERYCEELLVDTNGDKIYERDLTNCSMIGYFEEGVEYYIDIAYYDVYAAGTFTFDLKYVGETFDVFEEASQGVFTYDEISQEIIAAGINVKLCEDENDPRYGYYCHLLPNGELGSIVYADFHFTTNIFGSQSLEMLIDAGAFDMRMTELDKEAYVYFKNYYEKGGKAALRELWGDNFDANWALYQMEDVIRGIYHGKGPDYTEAVRKYLDKLDDGTDGTSADVVFPERQGCVPVDKELAIILQALMDKFTFEDVDHSWTKLCYYYKTLSAPKSVEEKLEELEAMVNGAEFTSAELAGEANLIVQELYAALEHWTIVSVERSLVDNALASVYRLIEVDKAQQ